MKISFVEIRNFRRLRSIRVDLNEKTTVLVGPNNSGKTSAMLAMRYFLVSPGSLTMQDIYAGNWKKIQDLGAGWEAGNSTDDLETYLPSVDLWLDVPLDQIQYVVDLLPSLQWEGGLLGVRLQYDLGQRDLREEYLEARRKVKALKESVPDTKLADVELWPRNLFDFLERKFHTYFKVRKFVLSTNDLKLPKHGVAQIQSLPDNVVPVDDYALKTLIRVNEIPAQRRLGESSGDTDGRNARSSRKLSEQLRAYYDRHINPSVDPSIQDLGALGAVQDAERAFDQRLREGFEGPLGELEELGYPGFTNPKISVKTKLRATDGLNHGSSVQYELTDQNEDEPPPLLPESYSGLGYQNLIAMVFMLLAFRDEWMQVGKEPATRLQEEETDFEPVHLVLIEEPEVHLHAQVQQVFIQKAHDLLTNHERLNCDSPFVTQLVVSTHSSHIAHETDFASLRYFRRQLSHLGTATSSTVANLSELFGTANETQRFVARYIKAVHCDLFFADAAIFVEGQAERILVPHFIQQRFPELTRRYITLLEVGGSHAHRFRKLVEALSLPTLVIADLDSVQGKSSVVPKRGSGQTTSNSVLKTWHPKKEQIDDLLDIDAQGHILVKENLGPLYVAYQKETTDGDGKTQIPRTFEDAFVFANQKELSHIEGIATTAKIRELVHSDLKGDALASALFEIIGNSEKAAFALDCLDLDPNALTVPDYINAGLTWLRDCLNK